MKATLKWLGVCTVVAAAVVFFGRAAQAADGASQPMQHEARMPIHEPSAPQNQEELMRAMAQFSEPGPEQKNLAPLAGHWAYTCRAWSDPSQPPMEMTGKAERNWVLGGRFLEEHIQGTGFDGKSPFEGMGLLGYDRGLKTYVWGWASNMSTGIELSKGNFDPATKTYTLHAEYFCPMRQKVVEGRNVLKIDGSDRVVMTIYQRVDGKELKTMEIDQTRIE